MQNSFMRKAHELSAAFLFIIQSVGLPLTSEGRRQLEMTMMVYKDSGRQHSQQLDAFLSNFQLVYNTQQWEIPCKQFLDWYSNALHRLEYELGAALKDLLVVALRESLQAECIRRGVHPRSAFELGGEFEGRTVSLIGNAYTITDVMQYVSEIRQSVARFFRVNSQ
jgi:hypothetical protein